MSDRVLLDKDRYVLCSICKKRFEPGDELLGQLEMVMEKYSTLPDVRVLGSPIYPVNNTSCIYLSTFHKKCLL